MALVLATRMPQDPCESEELEQVRIGGEGGVESAVVLGSAAGREADSPERGERRAGVHRGEAVRAEPQGIRGFRRTLQGSGAVGDAESPTAVAVGQQRVDDGERDV